MILVTPSYQKLLRNAKSILRRLDTNGYNEQAEIITAWVYLAQIIIAFI